jgi:hypothetical protein
MRVIHEAFIAEFHAEHIARMANDPIYRVQNEAYAAKVLAELSYEQR